MMKSLQFATVALFATLSATGAAQAQNMESATTTTTTTTSTAFPPYSTGFQPHAYIGAGAAIAKDQNTDDYRGNGKLYAGYDFTPNWGVEAGYIYFGKQNGLAYAGQGQVTPVKFRGNSSYVAAKYTVPLGERLSAFGKLGVEHSERKAEGGTLPSFVGRDTGVYGALGLQYSLTPNVAVSTEYERYGKDKLSGAKADAITVGLKYGF